MNEANTGVRYESSTIPVAAYQLQLEDVEVDDMLKLFSQDESGQLDTTDNTFRHRVTMGKGDVSENSNDSSTDDDNDDDDDDDDECIGEDFFSRVKEGASSSGQIVVVGNKWDKIWIQHWQKLKVCVIHETYISFFECIYIIVTYILLLTYVLSLMFIEGV